MPFELMIANECGDVQTNAAEAVFGDSVHS
jgi:hypothetical protein